MTMLQVQDDGNRRGIQASLRGGSRGKQEGAEADVTCRYCGGHRHRAVIDAGERRRRVTSERQSDSDVTSQQTVGWLRHRRHQRR